MIEFIVHYISIPDADGNISEGDAHIYGRDEAHIRDILNTLNRGAFYTIRPAKARTYRERVQACPHCSTESGEDARVEVETCHNCMAPCVNWPTCDDCGVIHDEGDS